jgi:L-fuconolactonase
MTVIVDGHQHFWDPATANYPWMTSAVAPLCRKFDPTDLKPNLDACGVSFTVLVQTRSSLGETREFLSLAAEVPFIAGIVGWVDLTDPDVDRAIRDLRAVEGGTRLVGVRHQVDDEPEADWLLKPEVWRGLEAVAEAGLTYDLLARPRNLPAAIATARRFPGMRFVLDHIGKPEIRAGRMDGWAACIERLGELGNVWCKVSGIATEAELESWRVSDLAPYVQHVRRCFGDDRLLFGSDWPVCLLAGSYERTLSSLVDALGELEEESRARIFGKNAITCYGLPIPVASSPLAPA